MATPEKDNSNASLIKAGVVASAHGIRGAVKIRSFTENPADLLAYGDVTDESGTKHYIITITSQGQEMLIANIEGITTRELAEALRGTTLWIASDRLPPAAEGEYYAKDLVGLEVKLNDCTIVGKVYAVHDFGAGDIIEIEMVNGCKESYSFSRSNFPEVNMAKRFLTFLPPDIIEGEE